jgi:hypothetical protein
VLVVGLNGVGVIGVDVLVLGVMVIGSLISQEFTIKLSNFKL